MHSRLSIGRAPHHLWLYGLICFSALFGIGAYMESARRDTVLMDSERVLASDALARLQGNLSSVFLLGSEPSYDRHDPDAIINAADRRRMDAMPAVKADLETLERFFIGRSGIDAIVALRTNVLQAEQLSQLHQELSHRVGDYQGQGLRQRLRAAGLEMDDALATLPNQSAPSLRHLLAARSHKDAFFAGFDPSAQAAAHRALVAFADEVRRAPMDAAARARLLDATTRYDQAFRDLSEGLLTLGATARKLEALFTESAQIAIAFEPDATAMIAALRADRVRFVQQRLAFIGGLLASLIAFFVWLSVRIARDLKRRESELQISSDRMHDLARVSSDLFWELDAKGFIRGIDGPEAFSSFYGARMVGQRFYDVLRDLGVKFSDDIDIARVWMRYKPFRDLEYKVVMPVTEQVFWYSLSGLPVFNDRGEFDGYRCASKDITSAKRLELEREAFRSQLASTLSHLPAAAFRIEQGRSGMHVAFVSHNALDVVGVPADVIFAKPADSSFFICDEDRERFDREIREGLDENNIASARGRTIHPGGQVRWIQALMRRTGVAGKTRVIDGIWIDVTADEIKSRQMRDIEAAVQAASDGVIIFGPDNTEVIYANDAIYRIVDAPPGTALTADLLRSRIRMQEADAHDMRARMAEGIAKSGQWRGHFTLHRDDGEKAIVLVRVTRLADGKFLHVLTDITDQIKLEDEREAARSQLSSTLAHLNAAAFRVEENAAEVRRTFVSDNAKDVIGISPAEFKAHDGESGFYFIEEDRDRVRREIRDGLAASGFASTRGRIRRADGSARWIQSVVRRVSGKDKAQTVEGIWIDVTEEEAKNSQLRDIEAAIQAAGDGIMFFSADGSLVFANASAYRILDVPAGSGLPLIRRRLKLSDEDAGLMRQNIRKSVTLTGVWTGELTVHRSDGTTSLTFCRVTGLNDGNLLYVLADMSETTRLRADYEKQLESSRAQNELVVRALDSVQDYICIEDKDHRLTYVNQITLDGLGVDMNEVLGKSFFVNERVKYDDNEGLERRIRAGLAHDGIWSGEMALTRPNGRRQVFNLRVSKLADGGALFAGTDITEQHVRAIEEQKLKQRLEAAERMEAIGRLAGGIAHDFNNIIGATRAFADLLVEDLPQGSQQRTHAERIVSASRRATDLVKEIMMFSRAGQAERQPVDIGTVIAEGMDILAPKKPANVTLEFQNLARPAVVDANASQIIQILVNLVVNSIDALDGKPGAIHLRAARVSAAGMADERTLSGYGEEVQRGEADAIMHQGHGQVVEGREYVKITVDDTGPGMTRTTMQRIFEPFFTTKGRDRGTGLGIPVVSSIVTAHGGVLRISTCGGRGTSVTVYLPVSDKRAVAASAKNPEARLRGRERILIVDDEVDLADAVSIGLSRLGYETAPVYSSVEALNLFKEAPTAWDVVISDQVMPRMEGLQLTKKIRALNPTLKIILCTGHSDAATERTARTAGANLFLHKPVTAEELAHAVRSLIDG